MMASWSFLGSSLHAIGFLLSGFGGEGGGNRPVLCSSVKLAVLTVAGTADGWRIWAWWDEAWRLSSGSLSGSEEDSTS